MYRPLATMVLFALVTLSLIYLEPVPEDRDSVEATRTALTPLSIPLVTPEEAEALALTRPQLRPALVSRPVNLPAMDDPTQAAQPAATAYAAQDTGLWREETPRATLRAALAPAPGLEAPASAMHVAPGADEALFTRFAVDRPRLLTTTARAPDGTLRPSLPALAGAPVLNADGFSATQQHANLTKTAAVHTVRRGDNLPLLALRYYGDAGKADLILDANRSRLSEEGTLRLGQIIKIPEATGF